MRKFKECDGDRSTLTFERGAIFFEYREKYTKKYAWAVPTEEALLALKEYSPIVEMGGGTGYWARLLSERGVDIVCFDKQPYHNNQASETWF